MPPRVLAPPIARWSVCQDDANQCIFHLQLPVPASQLGIRRSVPAVFLTGLPANLYLCRSDDNPSVALVTTTSCISLTPGVVHTAQLIPPSAVNSSAADNDEPATLRVEICISPDNQKILICGESLSLLDVWTTSDIVVLPIAPSAPVSRHGVQVALPPSAIAAAIAMSMREGSPYAADFRIAFSESTQRHFFEAHHRVVRRNSKDGEVSCQAETQHSNHFVFPLMPVCVSASRDPACSSSERLLDVDAGNYLPVLLQAPCILRDRCHGCLNCQTEAHSRELKPADPICYGSAQFCVGALLNGGGEIQLDAFAEGYSVLCCQSTLAMTGMCIVAPNESTSTPQLQQDQRASDLETSAAAAAAVVALPACWRAAVELSGDQTTSNPLASSFGQGTSATVNNDVLPAALLAFLIVTHIDFLPSVEHALVGLHEITARTSGCPRTTHAVLDMSMISSPTTVTASSRACVIASTDWEWRRIYGSNFRRRDNDHEILDMYCENDLRIPYLSTSAAEQRGSLFGCRMSDQLQWSSVCDNGLALVAPLHSPLVAYSWSESDQMDMSDHLVQGPEGWTAHWASLSRSFRAIRADKASPETATVLLGFSWSELSSYYTSSPTDSLISAIKHWLSYAGVQRDVIQLCGFSVASDGHRLHLAITAATEEIATVRAVLESDHGPIARFLYIHPELQLIRKPCWSSQMLGCGASLVMACPPWTDGRAAALPPFDEPSKCLAVSVLRAQLSTVILSGRSIAGRTAASEPPTSGALLCIISKVGFNGPIRTRATMPAVSLQLVSGLIVPVLGSLPLSCAVDIPGLVSVCSLPTKFFSDFVCDIMKCTLSPSVAGVVARPSFLAAIASGYQRRQHWVNFGGNSEGIVSLSPLCGRRLLSAVSKLEFNHAKTASVFPNCVSHYSLLPSRIAVSVTVDGDGCSNAVNVDAVVLALPTSSLMNESSSKTKQDHLKTSILLWTSRMEATAVEKITHFFLNSAAMHLSADEIATFPVGVLPRSASESSVVFPKKFVICGMKFPNGYDKDVSTNSVHSVCSDSNRDVSSAELYCTSISRAVADSLLVAAGESCCSCSVHSVCSLRCCKRAPCQCGSEPIESQGKNQVRFECSCVPLRTISIPLLGLDLLDIVPDLTPTMICCAYAVGVLNFSRYRTVLLNHYSEKQASMRPVDIVFSMPSSLATAMIPPMIAAFSTLLPGHVGHIPLRGSNIAMSLFEVLPPIGWTPDPLGVGVHFSGSIIDNAVFSDNQPNLVTADIELLSIKSNPSPDGDVLLWDPPDSYDPRYHIAGESQSEPKGINRVISRLFPPKQIHLSYPRPYSAACAAGDNIPNVVLSMDCCSALASLYSDVLRSVSATGCPVSFCELPLGCLRVPSCVPIYKILNIWSRSTEPVKSIDCVAVFGVCSSSQAVLLPRAALVDIRGTNLEGTFASPAAKVRSMFCHSFRFGRLLASIMTLSSEEINTALNDGTNRNPFFGSLLAHPNDLPTFVTVKNASKASPKAVPPASSTMCDSFHPLSSFVLGYYLHNDRRKCYGANTREFSAAFQISATFHRPSTIFVVQEPPGSRYVVNWGSILCLALSAPGLIFASAPPLALIRSTTPIGYGALNRDTVSRCICDIFEDTLPLMSHASLQRFVSDDFRKAMLCDVSLTTNAERVQQVIISGEPEYVTDVASYVGAITDGSLLCSDDVIGALYASLSDVLFSFLQSAANRPITFRHIIPMYYESTGPSCIGTLIRWDILRSRSSAASSGVPALADVVHGSIVKTDTICFGGWIAVPVMLDNSKMSRIPRHHSWIPVSHALNIPSLEPLVRYMFARPGDAIRAAVHYLNKFQPSDPGQRLQIHLRLDYGVQWVPRKSFSKVVSCPWQNPGSSPVEKWSMLLSPSVCLPSESTKYSFYMPDFIRHSLWQDAFVFGRTSSSHRPPVENLPPLAHGSCLCKGRCSKRTVSGVIYPERQPEFLLRSAVQDMECAPLLLSTSVIIALPAELWQS